MWTRFKTSWRRIQEVLKKSWRSLADVFARHLEDVLARHLEDILKTSWRCLEDVFARRLEGVLKTTWRRLGKTSWIRLEDVWLTRIYLFWSRHLEDVLKTVSEDEGKRCLQDVFKAPSSERMKMSWRCLEDVLQTFLQDILKTFWRRLWDVLARRLEDVRLRRIYLYLEDKYILKTSSEDEGKRRLHQDECLLGSENMGIVVIK